MRSDPHHDQKTFGARRMRAELRSPDGRVPPMDADCEGAFIADLLAHDDDGSILATVRDFIGPKDFAIPTLGLFFDAICDLRDMFFEQGAPPRPIGKSELGSWLRGQEALREGVQPCGVYLTNEEVEVLNTAHQQLPTFEWISSLRNRGVRAESRAQRIANLSRQRRAMQKLWDCANVGYEADPVLFRESLDDLFAFVSESSLPGKVESESFRDALGRVMTRLCRPVTEADERLVTTGLVSLDGIVQALPGKLIVIGARSSRGKSALSAQIGQHVAGHHGTVLYLTGEMDSDELSLRSLCTEATVDSARVTGRRVQPAEVKRLTDTAQKIAPRPLRYIDLTNKTVVDVVGIVRREMKRLEREGAPVKAIVVDYIQRVHAGRAAAPGANREQRVAAVAQTLKELAIEVKVPIFAPAQLRTDAEDKPDERPQVSDIRESKGIENEADIIILIHNWDYSKRVEREDEELPSEFCELVVGKNRGGQQRIAYVWFEPTYTKFTSMSVEDARHARRLREAAKEQQQTGPRKAYPQRRSA